MGNELKLSLENFQSITHGELVFHTGTNVIVGQSNSGKTATFRALKACLTNPSGSQRFIKNGSKQAVVTVEYNGNQITWKRTAKESSYTINGEDYIKTGSSNAFKIMEDTGFVRDDNDTLMNMEEELQLPFPFGISKSELFKLYENVFCVSDSAVILKSAKEHEDKAKSDIALLENDLLKNENKLKELKEFEEIFDKDKLISLKSYLEEKQERLRTLNDGLPLIKKAMKVTMIDLNGLDDFDTNNLLNTRNDLLNVKKEIYKLKKLHGIHKSLPEILNPVNKIAIYTELIELHKERELIKNLEGIALPEIQVENKLQEYKNLVTYKRDIKNIINSISQIEQKKKDWEEKLNRMKEKLKDVSVCPLCGQPLHHE